MQPDTIDLPPFPPEDSSGIALEDYQHRCVEILAKTRRGIVKVPAGGGKTIIAAAAIQRVLYARADRAKQARILWIANTLDQLDQARAATGKFPDLLSLAHFVFSHPSSASKSFAEQCDLVVVDECHHAAASTWAGVISLCPNARWGFSATPEREDDLRNHVFELLGKIVATVSRREVVGTGRLCGGTVVWHRIGPANRLIGPAQKAADPLFEDMWRKIPAFLKAEKAAKELAELQRLTADKLEPDAPHLFQRIHVLEPKVKAGKAKRAEIQSRALGLALVDLFERDELFLSKVRQIIDREVTQGHVVMVICRTVAHCHRIVGENGVVLSSRLSKGRRKEVINGMRSGEINVVAATSIADEGLDVPRLDRLIMVSPSRSARLAEQRTGRALRSFQGKADGIIHDFIGEGHYILSAQAKKRRRIYRSLGYEQHEATEEEGNQ